jgi:hypothetical protein
MNTEAVVKIKKKKKRKKKEKKEKKEKEVNSEVFNPEVATLRKEYSEA